MPGFGPLMQVATPSGFPVSTTRLMAPPQYEHQTAGGRPTDSSNLRFLPASNWQNIKPVGGAFGYRRPGCCSFLNRGGRMEGPGRH